MNADKIISMIESGDLSIKDIIAINGSTDKKLNDHANAIAMLYCKLMYNVEESKYKTFKSSNLTFYGNDEFSEASVNFWIDELDIFDSIEIPMDIFCGEYRKWTKEKAVKELAMLKKEEEERAKLEADSKEYNEYLRLKEKFADRY